MIIKGFFLWLLLTISIFHTLTANPVQFPEEKEKSVGSLASYDVGDAQPKFHHGSLHKRKKHKRKKGCRYRVADPKAEGRFFFYPLLNYYNTDINVYNGVYGNRPGTSGGGGGIIDPCSSLISGGGSVISGVGSILTGSSGSRPPLPISPGSGPVTSGGGGGGDNGDNTDENYDYSDGGDSDSSSSSNNGGSGLGSGNGISTIGSVVSNAPAAVSNILSSVNNSIRPIFSRPNRYFDYYVVRPFNRGVSQLLDWF